MRREFLDGNTFTSIPDAQAQLDDWVGFYNRDRPHQSLGMRDTVGRFRLHGPQRARRDGVCTSTELAGWRSRRRRGRCRATGRSVSRPATRPGGGWPAKPLTWSAMAGWCAQRNRGVLLATHARRHQPGKQTAGLRRRTRPPTPKATASAASVTRKVDSSGAVSFAGSSYAVGNACRRRQVQVAIVGDTVEISIGTRLIRTHKVKHGRTREHGALASPNRSNAA